MQLLRSTYSMIMTLIINNDAHDGDNDCIPKVLNGCSRQSCRKSYQAGSGSVLLSLNQKQAQVRGIAYAVCTCTQPSRYRAVLFSSLAFGRNRVRVRVRVLHCTHPSLHADGMALVINGLPNRQRKRNHIDANSNAKICAFPQLFVTLLLFGLVTR